MRVFHLCERHWGQGEATGVPRFSRYFNEAFDPIDITPHDIKRVRPMPEDLVVADNHLCMALHPKVPVVVVHHGCAQAHFDLDPTWRGSGSRSMCLRQQDMLHKRLNAKYVAPSMWVAEQFRHVFRDDPKYQPVIIPHWVPLIEPVPSHNGDRPLIIGDWRDHNKGSGRINEIRERLPEFEFKQILFAPGDDKAREAVYARADAYLCLSMSEGGPYSVADAEAANLPIISTDTGYVCEFMNMHIIDRDDTEGIRRGIQRALDDSLRPSFYQWWTRERWHAAWKEVLGI